MPQRKQITAYVVQRLSWEYGDDFYYRRGEEDAPIKTFLDRDKAEAYRREVQWEHVRASGINPFGYEDNGLAGRTSLPMPEFFRRLREAGLTVSEESEDVRWDLMQQYEKMADENKRLVWQATDQFQFFQLIAMQIELET